MQGHSGGDFYWRKETAHQKTETGGATGVPRWWPTSTVVWENKKKDKEKKDLGLYNIKWERREFLKRAGGESPFSFLEGWGKRGFVWDNNRNGGKEVQVGQEPFDRRESQRS